MEVRGRGLGRSGLGRHRFLDPASVAAPCGILPLGPGHRDRALADRRGARDEEDMRRKLI